MKKSDFYFDLPKELIAQTPLDQRDQSKMMHINKNTGAVEHRHFYELPDMLHEGDCLVLNDSRVLPARLIGTRPTGGNVEVLLLRDLGDSKWECLTKPGKKTRTGTEIAFGNGQLKCEVIEVLDNGNRIVKFQYDGIFLEILESLGKRSWKIPNDIRLFIPENWAVLLLLPRDFISPMISWTKSEKKALISLM